MGRHFVGALKNEEVHIVDDMTTGLHYRKWPRKLLHPNLIPKEKNIRYLHRGWFVYEEDCRKWFNNDGPRIHEENFDLVIHLAARVGGRESIEKLTDDTESISIDAEFFKWCAKTKPKKIVYMSSSAVYGTVHQNGNTKEKLRESFQHFPHTGGHLFIPDLAYGWSKLTGERLASLYAERYGLNILCPRPFSGYGEGQPDTYPMTAICKRALEKKDPLEVWGSGEQTRDFIHVDDIVQGVLNRLETLEGYQTMNIGSGTATSFLELAKLAAEIVGYEPEIKTLNDKPEGVKARVCDPTLFNQYHTPQVSLREGVTRVIRSLNDT